ncbi:hypothetical protein IC235_06760 [Hymenobacter sp. BT664]|uniref:STAS/SEC14 domain-containing protein n=1 Tax=Hymenobacter montanus TaxID=2771359 RepID=A0A927GIQ4_9BACT|nr:hypothetical protein [Hymenobacter montanus]MBD2767590.1 hypothetical protein [Hymenobacter montanus]
MRLYFENSVGRVLEHPDGYALVRYAAGQRDFAFFRAFLTHTGHLLRRYGWHQLLADQRATAPFTDEERTWVHEYWRARSERGGDELHSAVILPQGLLNRLSPTLLMNDSQPSALTYRLFEAEAEAVAWLHQQRRLASL